MKTYIKPQSSTIGVSIENMLAASEIKISDDKVQPGQAYAPESFRIEDDEED